MTDGRRDADELDAVAAIGNTIPAMTETSKTPKLRRDIATPAACRTLSARANLLIVSSFLATVCGISAQVLPDQIDFIGRAGALALVDDATMVQHVDVITRR